MQRTDSERYGYAITGEVGHVPSGVPGVAACGMRIDYERERDPEKRDCTWCAKGVRRGRARELARGAEATA